jgi:hypothetical protein
MSDMSEYVLLYLHGRFASCYVHDIILVERDPYETPALSLRKRLANPSLKKSIKVNLGVTKEKMQVRPGCLYRDVGKIRAESKKIVEASAKFKGRCGRVGRNECINASRECCSCGCLRSSAMFYIVSAQETTKP